MLTPARPWATFSDHAFEIRADGMKPKKTTVRVAKAARAAKAPRPKGSPGRAPKGMREHYALQVMSAATGKPKACFQIARSVAPGVYYDWVDPETGEHGQCRMNLDGSWHTKPRGSRPVVVLYVPPAPKPEVKPTSAPSAPEAGEAIAQNLLDRLRHANPSPGFTWSVKVKEVGS